MSDGGLGALLSRLSRMVVGDGGGAAPSPGSVFRQTSSGSDDADGWRLAAGRYRRPSGEEKEEVEEEETDVSSFYVADTGLAPDAFAVVGAAVLPLHSHPLSRASPVLRGLFLERRDAMNRRVRLWWRTVQCRVAGYDGKRSLPMLAAVNPEPLPPTFLTQGLADLSAAFEGTTLPGACCFLRFVYSPDAASPGLAALALHSPLGLLEVACLADRLAEDRLLAKIERYVKGG